MTLPSLLPARCCVLALVLCLCGCASTRPVPTPPADRHALLLISIDGLRADFLGRGLTPNLDRLARDGVRARWMTPSYPSLTFPNHYTLVTGLRPDHHGVIHNSMSDGALGDFRVGDLDAVGDARWWGGEPIWVGAERAGIRTASWAWPGTQAAIGGVRPGLSVPYDDRITASQRAQDVRGWLSAPIAQKPRLLTLYFEMADQAGHEHGPQSPQYATALRQVDAAIGMLARGMARDGTLSTTDIIIVSDHGMATVAPNHVIDVENLVPMDEAKVVSVGQSIGIEPRPGQEARVESRLLGAHDHYDCWRRQELPPRWHYGTHPRVPPIICQMHEGWDAVARESLEKRPKHADRGSHGYDPALPAMRAVFIAHGPSFRRGATLPPFDNVDVYPLLARLVGIVPAPNDGNPETLLPALRQQPRTPLSAPRGSTRDSGQ